MKPLKISLRVWQKTLLFLLLTVVMLGLAGAVLAAQVVSVDWRVIAGGGGKTEGARVVLNGTIGQPISGVSTSPGVILRAGYWGGLPATFSVFLPLTTR